MKPIAHVLVSGAEPTFRTEDVKFSPSGRLLAMVATDGCVILYSVDLSASPLTVSFLFELRSARLIIPHGIDFLSEDIIVVANRDADLAFFKLPGNAERGAVCHIDPIYEALSPFFGTGGVSRKLRERPLFCGPGSVRVTGNVLLVGCNYLNTVSTFKYSLDDNALVIEEGVLVAHEGLSVIDGIAISRDRMWMALSDHDHHRVVVYRRKIFSADDATGSNSHFQWDQMCSLVDIDLHYPHGLTFDKTGELLYVVDAGGRYVHAFRSSDHWCTDIYKSSIKIIGIEEEAYNKTHQATHEAYRMLEGGGKGLDLDPSGRVLVVTTRNQPLRFFSVEQFTPVIVNEGISTPLRDLASGDGIALSCVVDDTVSIWKCLVPWLASAIALGEIPTQHIYIHHVCDLKPEIQRLCEELGVNTRRIERFDATNVYANKIHQGSTDFGPVQTIVLTDVDVVFTGKVPFHELSGFVAGKTVDMPNPPLDLLKEIFSNAGVPVTALVYNEYADGDNIKTFQTVAGNFNGGLYVLPKSSFVVLSQRWSVWARWLLAKPALMAQWHRNLDQISFCMALNELNLPLSILNNSWNFPTHIDLPHVAERPWILHHHCDINNQGYLNVMRNDKIQLVAGQVNSAIKNIREKHNILL